MGMVAGAALLGPVGFVAGSLVGGSAAKSSMAALTGDPKKKKPALEEPRPSANDANENATQYQSNSQAPDLLSSDNQHHIPPRMQSAHPQQTRQGGAVQQQHQQHYPPQQSNHSSMPATAHQTNDRGHEGYRFGE